MAEHDPDIQIEEPVAQTETPAEKPPTDILQLELFATTGKPHTNYIALYDLAPRFAQRADRMTGAIVTSIKKEFPFSGDQYKVTVTPARITDSNGNEHDVLPGEREQLVEDVVRKFAAENLRLGAQDEITTAFSVYRIHKELCRHKHTFSKQEIREALEILNKSTIEITRVVEPGSRKPKPVLSAAAFPVLGFKDENDYESQAFVQLNPLVAQAIKSLAYEQVNYDWMMKIKGQLPRWVFKNVSLLLSDSDQMRDMVELRASDIANSFGSSRKRWREMLSEVTKAISKLEELGVISSYVASAEMTGKRKDDVIFAIRFSPEFMEDRRSARAKAQFLQSNALKHTGTRRPDRFQPISNEAATEIKLAGKLGTASAGIYLN